MRYIIKCDECKKKIGETESLMVSASGGKCSQCREKIKKMKIDWNKVK